MKTVRDIMGAGDLAIVDTPHNILHFLLMCESEGIEWCGGSKATVESKKGFK